MAKAKLAKAAPKRRRRSAKKRSEDGANAYPAAATAQLLRLLADIQTLDPRIAIVPPVQPGEEIIGPVSTAVVKMIIGRTAMHAELEQTRVALKEEALPDELGLLLEKIGYCNLLLNLFNLFTEFQISSELGTFDLPPVFLRQGAAGRVFAVATPKGRQEYAARVSAYLGDSGAAAILAGRRGVSIQ